MAKPIFVPGDPVASVQQVTATWWLGLQRHKYKDMYWQNSEDNLVRCGGENMAAMVMAYCLACMEAVAKEEEER